MCFLILDSGWSWWCVRTLSLAASSATPPLVFTDRGTDEAQKICCAQRPLHGFAWWLMVDPATNEPRCGGWLFCSPSSSVRSSYWPRTGCSQHRFTGPEAIHWVLESPNISKYAMLIDVERRIWTANCSFFWGESWAQSLCRYWWCYIRRQIGRVERSSCSICLCANVLSVRWMYVCQATQDIYIYTYIYIYGSDITQTVLKKGFVEESWKIFCSRFK